MKQSEIKVGHEYSVATTKPFHKGERLTDAFVIPADAVNALPNYTVFVKVMGKGFDRPSNGQSNGVWVTLSDEDYKKARKASSYSFEQEQVVQPRHILKSREEIEAKRAEAEAEEEESRRREREELEAEVTSTHQAVLGYAIRDNRKQSAEITRVLRDKLESLIQEAQDMIKDIDDNTVALSRRNENSDRYKEFGYAHKGLIPAKDEYPYLDSSLGEPRLLREAREIGEALTIYNERTGLYNRLTPKEKS